MAAHAAPKQVGVGLDRAQIVVHRGFSLPVDFTDSLDSPERAKPVPFRAFGQPFRTLGDRVTPGRLTSVIFPAVFMEIHQSGVPGILHEFLDVPVEFGVVVFQAKNVAGARLFDGLDDGLLRAHRVNSDDRSIEFQLFQKLGNCCDFVTFLLGLHLAQNEVVAGGPGVDQMDCLFPAGATQRFAVEGDEVVPLELAQTLGPADKKTG